MQVAHGLSIFTLREGGDTIHCSAEGGGRDEESVRDC